MGQIYICGAFSNAPNKQLRANSSTLGQPLPPAPPPPPTYIVGHVYTLFFQSFNIVWGGGVKQRNLKRITVLFLNSVLKTQKINAITQVSQGILWRFFKRAKQTVTREFIYTWSAPPRQPPPPPPTYNVGHVYTLFLQSFNIVWGGGVKQRNLKRITVLF